MSPTSMAAASQARGPSRTRTVRIAKSRRPAGVLRSQPDSSALTSPAVSRPGKVASLRFATVGTASASGLLIRPVTNKNRSSDRRAVTMLLASGTLRRTAPSKTKRVTCSPVSSARPCGSGGDTVDKNARTGGR
ncbi:hypothetical protein [Streptomyces sp. NPDC051677]|uniref:hypothetical protein n=1 Tax=Streptomyces sp. NPDC051677 TaxID=3365669 RepID=UPI0037D46468